MNVDYNLKSNDKLTEFIKSKGIYSWNKLTKYIQHLPYGRNKNRTDFTLVLSEKKGTCSSKHALLKNIANLNNIPNITLILGIYRMTAQNTPKIGTALSDNSIDFIPEAHCYLRVNGNRVDLTTKQSNISKIEKDIIQEIEIEPQEVIEFKVEYHKKFIKQWLKETNLGFEFEQIWKIREKCIFNLSNTI